MNRTLATIALALAAAVALPASPLAGADGQVPDGHIEAAACPDWLERTYRIAGLTSELGLDAELGEDLARIQACVERDSGRTRPVIPTGWCDNFLKVHCSAFDLLDTLAEAQLARCESDLDSWLDEAEGERREAWRECARDQLFERYARQGGSLGPDDCRAAVLEGCGAPGDSPESASRGAWPQWGGPDRDFRAPAAELATSWAESGPPTLWSRPLGEGYSAILFESGRLYTMYRDGTDEVVVALDARNGATIWEHRYRQELHPKHLSQYGDGPRSTPLLLDDRLFTVGVAGRLLALDKASGDLLWSRELWGEEVGGEFQGSGYSSSPLGHGGRVIVPVGGERAGLAAFDAATGSRAWSSGGSRNSYSSPTLLQIAGRAQLVSFMAEEVVALDPESGAPLWSYPHANQWGHNIHLPAVAGGDIVFLSSPQVGSRGLRIVPDGEAYRAEELWSNRRVQLYHVSSIQEGDWVYGSTGVSSPAFMVAVNLRTGETAWRERGMAKANCVEADGRLVILDEDGSLHLATATPEAFSIEARTQLFDGVSWTVPTIVGTTLYARDTERIVAVDLG